MYNLLSSESSCCKLYFSNTIVGSFGQGLLSLYINCCQAFPGALQKLWCLSEGRGSILTWSKRTPVPPLQLYHVGRYWLLSFCGKIICFCQPSTAQCFFFLYTGSDIPSLSFAFKTNKQKGCISLNAMCVSKTLWDPVHILLVFLLCDTFNILFIMLWNYSTPSSNMAVKILWSL